MNWLSVSNIVIDPHVKALMDSAATGLAAKEFISSQFGKHIVNRASIEVDDALAEFIEADPTNAKSIASIQNRIHVAQSAIQWLMEAITEGENAMRELDETN